MSPELIAIIAAAVMILGFLWSLYRDVAGVHRGIVGLRRGVAHSRERMVRLEGLFEGFARREPSAPPA